LARTTLRTACSAARLGLLFPLISYLTAGLCLLDWLLRKRSSSPILIPLIGPLALNTWLLIAGKPLWTLVLPWILDLGTVWFFLILPRLVREWWQTCHWQAGHDLTWICELSPVADRS
jgi:hypothetical protein